jgi:cytochrome c553
MASFAGSPAKALAIMLIVPRKDFEAIPPRRGSRIVTEAALMVMVTSVTAGASPIGSATAETVQQGPSDDFRAAFATSQDVAEGKRLADASCTRCHGANGISTIQGVPHLAGQRAVYLHLELLAYKSGARGKSLMADAARFLSNDALIKVAAWYSTLDPARPAPVTTSRSAASGRNPVSAGMAAAASCGSCHGEAGTSRIPGMPNLVGLDSRYLVAATKAYKGGQRKHDMMKSLVAGLGDDDINNIALYFAAQKPVRAQTPAPGNVAAGKAAAAACNGCHGEAGVSAGTTPSLAGQDAVYLVTATHAYKNGSRSDPMMNGPASTVGDSALTDIAAYYASLQPQQPKAGKTIANSEWVERCDRCHGVNGNSMDPRVPALAAQRADYLDRILNAYRTGERASQAMSAMAKVLTEAEVRMLADYYSQQRARAVVYVRLPSNP